MISHASPRVLAEAAKQASRALAALPRAPKDRALTLIAEAVVDGQQRLLAANAEDVARAREAGAEPAFVDRLALDPRRVRAMADAIREIALLDDPVGAISEMKRRPNDLLVGRVRVPLGVILMIYEARPNVTTDAAALCIKSGNAVLLRGGSDAQRSNAVLGEIIAGALAQAGLPEDSVQIVPPGERDQIKELLALTGLVDLAIPRGGAGLIRFVTENARVPVIQHFAGVCHMFVDETCDLARLEPLVVDAKLGKPSACNALECLLVHRAVLPRAAEILSKIVAERGLELRADPELLALVPGAHALAEADLGCEFLAPILAAKVVGSLDEALAHIARHGSTHTEAILTNDLAHAERFLREIDASCVLVNASTRFNDGGELGLGAEMGISTSKLHAFGPMGLTHLTSEKWIVRGSGQVRG